MIGYVRLFTFVALTATAIGAEPAFRSLANTPPMGWNSWDCFGTTLAEEQAMAQADAMSFADLGISGKASVRDLWTHKDLGEFSGSFEQELALHGAGLYRIWPTQSLK